MEAVHESELEEEVEVADTVRERIELIIIELDSALNVAADRSRGFIPEHPEPFVGDSTLEPPHDPPHHERGESLHRDVPPDHPSSEEAPHEMRSSMTVPADPLPPADPSSVELLASSPRVKLPKLSLKKFNGDLTKWMTFWDTFESAVHNNPALTSIDKFSYLTSLLESTASEAVAGLTLTAVNYDEAVATLKRRFGSKQLIINRHMDLLLHLEPVTSQHNLKGLRQIFDVVESNVRGLRALGVPASSYGGLLSSILMARLPPELRLIVSRELSEDEWNLESMMEIIRREIEARERSMGVLLSQTRRSSTKPPPTSLSLTTGASTQASCAYCSQPHPSSSCQVIMRPEERKQALRTSGHCFVCLRRNHISRNCRSSARCSKCRGRHHISICSNSSAGVGSLTNPGSPPAGHSTLTATGASHIPTTSSMCVNCHTPILLQTAKAVVCDASQPEPAPALEVRAILDAGSQKSYVTIRVQETLHVKRSHSESMIIKTFGSGQGERRICDIVQLKIATNDGDPLILSAVAVPHICDPVRVQPISSSQASCAHLSGLELADSGDITGDLEIDLLIGSDYYWRLVTGRVLKGDSGPTAVETRLGWVLSGPTEVLQEDTTINFTSAHSSHVLRVDSVTELESLDAGLRRFWELESLGVLKDEQSVHKQFTQQIAFKQGRYEVHLPWKDSHPHLPNNYSLCCKRLNGLLKRLRQNTDQLQQYDAVIQDQLRQGVVEVVNDPAEYKGGKLHYLPHHGVFRHDKLTTKLRVVYDASAKTDGPSLNDCLYTGPNFGQNILDILLRFRLHRVALIGDVEKAFLMVSVADCDRDVLRFLWISDVKQSIPEIIVLRFTRVVFGVSASPFLLNATIDHHMEKFRPADSHFVEKFRRSIYVDDLTAGSRHVEGAYEFYVKAKLHLAEASFNLRKFESNSSELHRRILRE